VTWIGDRLQPISIFSRSIKTPLFSSNPPTLGPKLSPASNGPTQSLPACPRLIKRASNDNGEPPPSFVFPPYKNEVSPEKEGCFTLKVRSHTSQSLFPPPNRRGKPAESFGIQHLPTSPLFSPPPPPPPPWPTKELVFFAPNLHPPLRSARANFFPAVLPRFFYEGALFKCSSLTGLFLTLFWPIPIVQLQVVPSFPQIGICHFRSAQLPVHCHFDFAFSTFGLPPINLNLSLITFL